jgi:hypothetical protein
MHALPAFPCRCVVPVPYFIYKLQWPRPPEKAGAFEAYREARSAVREMRRALGRDDLATVRMVFAAGEAQAERLLTERREPRPLGEDA